MTAAGVQRSETDQVGSMMKIDQNGTAMLDESHTNGATTPNTSTILLHTSLLGAPGEGALPMWLDPVMFLQPSFDPERAVVDLRRHVPLAALQTELQTYLAALKAKMVEVINEDYSDYVSLSGKLVNVDGSVVRMRKPLTELKEKLGVLCESVRGELGELGAGLRKRKEVAGARALLELQQELGHLAGKVDKLLQEVAASGGAEAGGAGATVVDLDARARLLERVAGEVSRLSFQANRGKDLAFVRAMEPRIVKARTALQSALGAALEEALTSGPAGHGPALHCMHAYAELGLAEPVEAALRKLVVGPLAERLATEHKGTFTLRVSSSPATEGGLAGLLKAAESRITAALGSLLTAALAPQSPLRAFDLLGNVLLHEVDTVLGTHMPGVFSPGVPHAFHTNFLAAQAFLESLERRCTGRTALDRLRASPAWAAFARRWNTSVYFSLLYQEVAGELEDAASGGRPDMTVAAASPAGCVLPVGRALATGLARCAAPEAFLPPLADKFLKLALQLGQRYCSWVGELCTARQQRGTAPGGAPTAAAGSSPFPEGPGSTPPPAPAPTGPAAWVGNVALDELAVVYQDGAAVAQYVRSTWATAFLALFMSCTPEVVAAVGHAAQQLAVSIETQSEALLAVVGEEVAEACVGLVRQLRGITATYRMTSKGPPTRHSHYVTSVLGPLRALLDAPRVARLPQTAQRSLALGVVNAVSARYKTLAEELLLTVRKTEMSLKRLKKVQQPEGDASGMSDPDKITLQLYLDVGEYGQQFARLGLALNPSDMPAYCSLLEAVTPSPEVLAAVATVPAPT